MGKSQFFLRPASGADTAQVAALVQAAYAPYVERIGVLPGPLTEDYARVIAERKVTLALSGETLAGVLVLDVTAEGFLIDNIAVHPAWQGRGLGRLLLEFAGEEARRLGFDSIYLYTHEKMIENIAIYSHIGYVEFDRRSQGDISLVYMRKYFGKLTGG